MAWVWLIMSGILEAVWATALGASDGLSRPGPTALFALTLTLSMVGLAAAMRGLPLSLCYAVWTGIGAALTVGWAMATGAEPISAWRVVFLLGIIAAIVGLKATSPTAPARPPASADQS